MTLYEFTSKLLKLMAERPELVDAKAVYSVDDEGNAFRPVYWTANPGFYSEDGEWYSEDDLEDGIDGNVNAVCIN